MYTHMAQKHKNKIHPDEDTGPVFTWIQKQGRQLGHLSISLECIYSGVALFVSIDTDTVKYAGRQICLSPPLVYMRV